MIISGNFVALQKEKDFVAHDEGPIMDPQVVWFNLKNVSSLSCYEDGTYILTLVNSEEGQLELTAEAASELIKHMRKERDDSVRSKLEEMKDDPGFRDAVKFYFDHVKEEHDDNER